MEALTEAVNLALIYLIPKLNHNSAVFYMITCDAASRGGEEGLCSTVHAPVSG